MLVRYRYRVYLSPGQQQALAQVFGCARVVYNDCLRLREECYAAVTQGFLDDQADRTCQ